MKISWLVSLLFSSVVGKTAVDPASVTELLGFINAAAEALQHQVPAAGNAIGAATGRQAPPPPSSPPSASSSGGGECCKQILQIQLMPWQQPPHPTKTPQSASATKPPVMRSVLLLHK